MQLAAALDIRLGDVVAFVGAGGKSSAMRRLAHELGERGWRVLITTTTKIRLAEGQAFERLVVQDALPELLTEVEQAFAALKMVAVASGHVTAEKLAGVPIEWIKPLAGLADVVLIEADGARGRSLKAPAAHEPVIPACATVVVALAGLDALGQPLDEAVLHRPERVRALLADQVDQITPEVLGAVLAHALGGAKAVPDAARFIPFLNKADVVTDLAPTRVAAQQLLARPQVERVCIGALAQAEPVWERWQPCVAIILAAGGARRYGQLKQLLNMGGQPVVQRVVETTRASGFQQVILVLGHEAERIQAALGDISPAQIVYNPDWQAGMSTSLRASLQAVEPRMGAAMWLAADQPLVSVELLRRLLWERAMCEASIVAPQCDGRWRNPALFDRSLFPALRAVQGDRGGRDVVVANAQAMRLVPWEEPACFFDIDQPMDYAQMLSIWDHKNDR